MFRKITAIFSSIPFTFPIYNLPNSHDILHIFKTHVIFNVNLTNEKLFNNQCKAPSTHIHIFSKTESFSSIFPSSPHKCGVFGNQKLRFLKHSPDYTFFNLTTLSHFHVDGWKWKFSNAMTSEARDTMECRWRLAFSNHFRIIIFSSTGEKSQLSKISRYVWMEPNWQWMPISIILLS